MGDVLHQDRRAAALGDHHVLDVFGSGEQADAADEVLLAPLLDVAAAGVGVATLHRLRKLRKRDLVIAQPGKIRAHLVLLHQPAQAHHVGDAGNEAQLPRYHPVLVSAQLARPLASALHAVAVDLADGGGERRQLGLRAFRKVDLAQPLDHLLAREIAVHAVVEGEDDERKPELRVREHANRARQSGECDLHRDGDLLFDLLGGAAGKERDHGDLRVGDVRECFHGQVLERPYAAADEKRKAEQDEERLVEREGDDAADHFNPWRRGCARGGGCRRPPPCRWRRGLGAPPGSRP